MGDIFSLFLSVLTNFTSLHLIVFVLASASFFAVLNIILKLFRG